MDTHSHSQSELPKAKKRRREEKPEPLPSPEQDQEQSSSKKKRRRKKKTKEDGTESHEHAQVLFPEPVVVVTPIPITLESPKELGAEPVEATAVHPVPDQRPKRTHRKKKKESVIEPQAEPEPEHKETSNTDYSQPQLCSVKKKKKKKGVELNEAVAEHSTVCHEPPAMQGEALPEPQGVLPEPKPKEPSNAEHPVPDSAAEKDPSEIMKREKRGKEKKSVLEGEARPELKEPSNTDDSRPQLCSVKKKKKRKGVESNEAVAEHSSVCTEPPAVQGGALPEPKPKEPSNVEHSVPDSAPQKMKREKVKKIVLEPQPELKEPSNTGDSQPQLLCSVKKKKKRKGAEPNEAVAEHSTVCHEPPAVQGGALPEPQGVLPEPKPKEHSNAEHPLPDSAPEKMKQGKEKKSVLEPQEAQPEAKEPSNTDDSQPQLLCSVKKKKKRKGTEPNEAAAEHSTVCHEPPAVQGGALPEPQGVLLEPKPTEHPVPDPIPPKDTPKKMKRKKEKKCVLEPQGAQPEPEPKEPSNTEHSQPQLCSGKKNKRKEKGAEPNEANAELPLVCPELPLDIAIPTDPEKSKKGAEPNEANAELPPVCLESNAEYPQVCPEPPIDIAIPIDPGNTKSRAEPSELNAEHSPVCPEPPSDIAIPIDPEENKKGAEPNAGLPLVCPEPPFDKAIPIDPEKNRKEAEPNAEHPQACPEPRLGLAIPIDPEKNKGENLTPTDENELNTRNTREELVTLVTSDEKIVNPRDHLVPLKSIPGFVLEQQTQPGPVIPVCPNSASLIGQSQTIPLVDTEQKIKKKYRLCKRKRKRKGMNSMPDETEPNEHNTEMPESKKRMLDREEPNQCNAKLPETLMLASNFHIDQAIPSDSNTAVPTNPEHKTPKKWKKREKKKNVLLSEGGESNEHNGQPTETPVQKSVNPIKAPSIDPTLPTDQPAPIDLATPKHSEGKMSMAQRENALLSEGAKSNEHNGQPTETPVQKSVSPIKAPSIDPTLPTHQLTPIYLAAPKHSEGKMSKAQRENALLSEGAKSNEHNGQPTETPVQKSVNPIKAPSMDPTLPTDQPVPIDLVTPNHSEGKMSKAQRSKQKKRAIKSAGSESVHNSDQNAKTPVRRTRSLKLVKAKVVKAKSFMASRQDGHKLKSLSKDEEICFFCGEIGHSLARCSVSRAGGGLRRFVKCLICHTQGHFSYNCTRNGHGLIQSHFLSGLQLQNVLMPAVEAEGKSEVTVEAEGKSEVTVEAEGKSEVTSM